MGKTVFYILVCVDEHADEAQIVDQLKSCNDNVDVLFASSVHEAEHQLQAVSCGLAVYLPQQLNQDELLIWTDFFQQYHLPSILYIQSKSSAVALTPMVMLSKNNSLTELIEEKLSMLEKQTSADNHSIQPGRVSPLHQELIKEAERERIARDIHDALGNDLLTIRLDLDWLAEHLVLEEEKKMRFERARQVLTSVSASVRKIAQDLRPDILRDFGLIEASRRLIEDYRQRAELFIHFESNVEELSLSSDKSLTLFRLLQESFVNIVKHAFATEVKVVLNCLPTEVSLTISDNGIGISDAALDKPKSIGLKAMRARVLMCDGDVQFSESEGGGFCILAALPLP